MAGEPEAPVRMTLTDLLSGETREPQYNPEQVTEEISANWAELSVLGYSHKPSQYQNSDNFKITFDLAFDTTTAAGGQGGGDGANETRQFLMAFCIPPENAQDVLTGAPSRCLFVWPDMWAFQSQIRKIKNVHSRFAKTGGSTLWTCNVELVFVSDFRILSSDVRNHGFLGSG